MTARAGECYTHASGLVLISMPGIRMSRACLQISNTHLGKPGVCRGSIRIKTTPTLENPCYDAMKLRVWQGFTYRGVA